MKMNMPEFYKKRIENGPIILFEKRDVPVVSVMAAVPFGSAYEPENFSGMAHFIEHMVFKGTKSKSSSDIRKLVEDRGGILNAFTSKEITGYWAKLPSKHIEKGIDVISDMMLNPIFDKKEMEKERKVILQEIKMNHDAPPRFAIRKVSELLYKKPFGLQTIGTENTLKMIKQENMFDSHKIYCPQNIVISVVGNANFDDMIKLIKKNFCVERHLGKLKDISINRVYGEFIDERDNIHQASVALAFHAPPMRDKLRYAAQALNTIYGGDSSSRLFEEIREKRGLAYTANSEYEFERSYGHISAFIGTVKESVKEVKKIAIEEMEKLQKITDKELIEIKEKMIGSFDVESEESDKVALNLIIEELAGNAENYYKYEDYVNNIKLEDVRNLAKIKGYSFVAVMPKN